LNVDFWTRLEQVQARWNVLEHPFYRRWSAGELTLDELATYAGEYRHAVVALSEAAVGAARAAEPAVRAQLEEHAAEEAGHVQLWDDFARAVGSPAGAQASPESAACARAWSGEGRALLETLVALYAIESAQPAISEAKRVGLRAHYGIDDRRATAYFDLHATRDREHAAAGRALIEERLGEGDADALIAEAEAALRGNWELLDGVERLNGR
jgi:pyrroloquinoline-quinone synthase